MVTFTPTRSGSESNTDPRSKHVVTVSAKSKVSLGGNLEKMIHYLDVSPNISMADLSYSTTARRHQHNYRVAIPTSGRDHLKKQLLVALENADTHKPVPSTGPPSIAFVFTGQGASFKSYNLELYHQSPYFRSQIHHLDTLAQGQGFQSFIPVLDGSHHREHSHSPVITQLAQTCSQIALTRYWATLGVRPDVIMGHSLGEYAALHIAGVLSASDTVFLVGQRAKMLEDHCQAGSNKMVAVRASPDQIKAASGDHPYEIACIHSPKDTVIAGPVERMDAIITCLNTSGYKCISVNVPFAFHSEHVDPILEEFEAIMSTGVLWQTPNLPIISPLLSKVIFGGEIVNGTYLRRALRETVNFSSALEAAYKSGTIDDETVWVEIGPHPVCISYVKSTLPGVNVATGSLRVDDDNWATLTKAMATLHCAGVAVDWNEFYKPFEGSLSLLDLPTYA